MEHYTEYLCHTLSISHQEMLSFTIKYEINVKVGFPVKLDAHKTWVGLKTIFDFKMLMHAEFMEYKIYNKISEFCIQDTKSGQLVA